MEACCYSVQKGYDKFICLNKRKQSRNLLPFLQLILVENLYIMEMWNINFLKL